MSPRKRRSSGTITKSIREDDLEANLPVRAMNNKCGDSDMKSFTSSSDSDTSFDF